MLKLSGCAIESKMYMPTLVAQRLVYFVILIFIYFFVYIKFQFCLPKLRLKTFLVLLKDLRTAMGFFPQGSVEGVKGVGAYTAFSVTEVWY